MNPRSQTAEGPARKAFFIAAHTVRLQRKCACGQHMTGGEECEECKKKQMGLQRHSGGTPGPAAAPSIVHDVLRSSGEPLDTATRTLFEPRFGHDFSKVRVHTDDRSAASARTVSALAYTVGNDVVFGSGQYSPSSARGQELLAHELTHVVQQQNVSSLPLQQRLEVGLANDPYEREADEAAGKIARPEKARASDSLSSALPRVQRAKAAEASAGAGAAPENAATMAPTHLVVEDDAEHLRLGQMRKMQFLNKLEMSVCATADDVLTSVGRTAKGCPYIERWIGHLRSKSSHFVERGIRKYAPDSGGVTSAEGYIPFVAARVRRGVMRWARTGEVSEVPDELKGELLGANISKGVEGAISKIGGALVGVASLVASGVGKAASAIGGLFAKQRDGGVRDGGDPRHIQSQLGSGQPLDNAVRSRMETAFGGDFSPVRIHQDSTAAGLSAQLNARAFTVGRDVAFGAGEYRPGTLIGDALIAHELAHVAQQQEGATSAESSTAESRDLERDADDAAVAAVFAMPGKHGAQRRSVKGRVAPSLKSGLRLSRCAHEKGAPAKSKAAAGSALAAECPAAMPAASRSAKPVTIESSPEYFKKDEAAIAIIKASRDSSIDMSQRSVTALRTIIEHYYSANQGDVKAITFNQSRAGNGLATEIKFDPAGKRYVGEIFVGSGFTNSVAAAHTFAHEVLRVGHELEHIQQHALGMGGDKKSCEREFCAYAHEALALEVEHTGFIGRPDRVGLIDTAIAYFYCLGADDQKKYQSTVLQRLLDRRAQEMTEIPKKKYPTVPPASPPTACVLPTGAVDCRVEAKKIERQQQKQEQKGQ